jgi:RNA 3'-terminal phosphate cyclase (ATP)
MLYIDGAQKSGSGTIVRHAVALAALRGEELHLNHIRARRDTPGLRPQHLTAIQAVAQMCQGTLDGAKVGSRQIKFTAGDRIRAGHYEWDIGTAGSTTMLALTVLPLALFAPAATTFRLRGGLFQDFAPSAYHLQQVIFPLLRRMGATAELKVIRPGYVPRGGGVIELRVLPLKGKLQPLRLESQGKVKQIRGIALSSHLAERKVSQRMAKLCQEVLRARGYAAEIEIVQDTTASQPGAALALFALTDTGCIMGADMAGAPRRSSEQIGRQVARCLLEDLDSGATVDRHAADQLVLYAALAEGSSQFRVPGITEHLETNLWLVENILGARAELEGYLLKIQGVGFSHEPD